MSAATRALRLQVLPDIDAVAQRRAERLNATCRKGCSACCYQVVYATGPEALLIAETLLRDKARLEGMLPKLRAGALLAQQFGPKSKQLAGEDLDKAGYFVAHVPCAFLDGATTLCSIYAERPIACRTYYVASDPALCGAAVYTEVQVLNMRDMLLAQLHFATACGNPNIAPLANAVLWALSKSCHVPHPMYRPIREACDGVIFPDEWTQIAFGDGEPARAEVSP